MSWLEAIFLGFIQGLTEFLPVSSSGHLVVFQKIIGELQHDILFDISVHLGTLVAVLIIYKDTITGVLTSLLKRNQNLQSSVCLLIYIVLASMPTAIIGFLFKDYFEAAFENLSLVSATFLITAAVLFLTKRVKDSSSALDMSKGMEAIDTLNWYKALLIGFAQSFAILPGISRSGMTVASALFLGVRKDAATMFSFFIAIPAIIGAMLLQLATMETTSNPWSVHIVGFFAALIFGYVGLKSLIRLVQKGNLAIFSLYLILISLYTFFFLA